MASTSLANLLSPQQAGALMAPFRSRISNPDGFDSKMKIWIESIQEWLVANKRLNFSIRDIQQSIISDNGIRPAKECLKLVLSEMRRRSLIVQFSDLTRFSRPFRPPSSIFGDIIDDTTWLGWSLSNLIIKPAGWAVSMISQASSEDNNLKYSDQVDNSIHDTMQFVCVKALDTLSRNLHDELVRISKAEEEIIFEWAQLLELLEPMLPSMITFIDRQDLKISLDVIMDYLESKGLLAFTEDSGVHILKIIPSDTMSLTNRDHSIEISKKDIAMYRLKKSKALLNNEIDRISSEISKLKDEAIQAHKCEELTKAKGLMRNIKRLTESLDEKHMQLVNVETLMQQLISTESNTLILQAYKDGAEALKSANQDTKNELQKQ